MKADPPLIDVRDLSIAFAQGGERKTVVDRVSFRLEKGKALALVGESGSGKSVTAQAIVRLLPQPAASYPTGEILFRGRDVLKMIGRGTARDARRRRHDGVPGADDLAQSAAHASSGRSARSSRFITAAPRRRKRASSSF